MTAPVAGARDAERRATDGRHRFGQRDRASEGVADPARLPAGPGVPAGWPLRGLRVGLMGCVLGAGCSADEAEKSPQALLEVRPVGWSSARGDMEGWADYTDAPHIHATSFEHRDHTTGLVERSVARLDGQGFWAEVTRTTTPDGAQQVEAHAYDPATAMPDSVSHTSSGGAVRTVSHFERDAMGRVVAEVWELWDTRNGQSVLSEERVQVYPLSGLMPVGDHGDYFSILASETRYTSAGNVFAVRASSGGTADRPERFESDTDGDGVVDRVEFAVYELDEAGYPNAIHLGCPTAACDQPEQSFVIEQESGRLARIQVWEPTSSDGTLRWRSTTHFRWTAHPFEGPTGPHLDVQRTSPDNLPLAGFEERTWDANGWTTQVFNQAEEVVDTIWVETETVTLTLPPSP